MKRLTICLLLSMLAITVNSEVVGEFKGIIVAAATPAELAETVFPPFYLIANADAPNDLRMSDGLTPGGLRVCPEGVLTNIPNSFPHPVAMNGNPIALNGAFAIGAEGPHCYIRSNGSNVLSILAQPAGVGQTLSTEYAGNDTLRVMLAVEDSAVDPLVEYSTTVITPSWSNCSYAVARPSTNTVQLDIEIPEEDPSGYYRITALSGFRARFGIPLEAPIATFGDGIVIGNSGREITRNTTTDALLLAGGDAWNTGAMFELGGDSAPGDVAGGSAQLLLKDSTSGFKIRRREDWSTLFSVDQSGTSIAGATFRVSGTNLLLIINNVTNLVNLTPQ